MFNQFNNSNNNNNASSSSNNNDARLQRLMNRLEPRECLDHPTRVYALEQIKEWTQELIALETQKRILEKQLMTLTPPVNNILRSPGGGRMFKSLEKAVEDLMVSEDVTPPRTPNRSGTPTGIETRTSITEYEKISKEYSSVEKKIESLCSKINTVRETVKFSDDLDRKAMENKNNNKEEGGKKLLFGDHGD